MRYPRCLALRDTAKTGCHEIHTPAFIHKLLDGSEWKGHPEALKAIENERQGLLAKCTWDESKIRPQFEILAEARATGKKIHIGSLMVIVSIKGFVKNQPRKAKMNKAMGCDLLPSNVCHLFAREISRLPYPILIKQAITLEEALEYKGGLLIPACKGKGKTTDVSLYQGLLLNSIVGKSAKPFDLGTKKVC